MKDPAYDQHSMIALKAQELIDYLCEQRQSNGDSAMSAFAYNHVMSGLVAIKRMAVSAHEVSSGRHDDAH